MAKAGNIIFGKWNRGVSKMLFCEENCKLGLILVISVSSPSHPSHFTILVNRSLKARLEAYYSLIAPEVISNQAEWKAKFEKIFEKYGGSYEAERKLASKLATKYGTSIRLLLVERPTDDSTTERSITRTNHAANCEDELQQRDESWFKLTPLEENSGDIRFTSDSFDPFSALQAPDDTMTEANPWLMESPRLDTVGQFALLLPHSDPLRIHSTNSRKRPAPSNSRATNNKVAKAGNELHPFDSLSQAMTAGPLSRLQEFRGQRVRIIVRYVNAIRGTLTGILIAFDKHMNMILRDVEESYSMRPVGEDKSNVQIEMYRREKISGNVACEKGEWFGRKRWMKNILVRGDIVVVISKADQEKEIPQSRYVKAKVSKPSVTEPHC